MTERMTHEEYIAMQRRHVADLARRILAREIDVLDGSSQIARLRYELDVDDNNVDIMAFVLVESETDALPIGSEASLNRTRLELKLYYSGLRTYAEMTLSEFSAEEM
jgi:hypothetical protein